MQSRVVEASSHAAERVPVIGEEHREKLVFVHHIAKEVFKGAFFEDSEAEKTNPARE